MTIMEMCLAALVIIGLLFCLFCLPTIVMFCGFYIVEFVRTIRKMCKENDVVLLGDVHKQVMDSHYVDLCTYKAENYGDPDLLFDFGSPYIVPVVNWFVFVAVVFKLLWMVVHIPVEFVLGGIWTGIKLIWKGLKYIIVSPVQNGWRGFKNWLKNIKIKG